MLLKVVARDWSPVWSKVLISPEAWLTLWSGEPCIHLGSPVSGGSLFFLSSACGVQPPPSVPSPCSGFCLPSPDLASASLPCPGFSGQQAVLGFSLRDCSWAFHSGTALLAWWPGSLTLIFFGFLSNFFFLSCFELRIDFSTLLKVLLLLLNN